MKYVFGGLFALALFVYASYISEAGVLTSFNVDTSTSNLATTYGTGATSLVASGVHYAQTICMINSTSSTVALNVDTLSTSSAPTADRADIYLPAGVGRCIPVDPRNSTNVYLRSASGSTISSGKVQGDLDDK